MKSRAIIPLVVGLGLGVVAVKMFFGVLKNAKGANTGETVELLCAATDIPPAVEVTEAMLVTKAVPKAFVPKMAFYKKSEVVGRVTSMVVPGGSPIVASVLAPPGTPPGMAVRIPDGHRAVAVQIDEYAGVAGWLKPETRVDVIAMMMGKRSGPSEAYSKVILQDVLVLAVGQDMGIKGDPNASVTKSVTLALKPVDVPKLHLAASKSGSKLRLAMRGQNDRDVSALPVTTDNDLLIGQSSAPSTAPSPMAGFLSQMFSNQPKNARNATDKATKVPAAQQLASVTPAKPAWVIEMVNGTQVDVVRFDGKGANARRLENEKSKPGSAGRSGDVQPAVEKQPEPQAPGNEPAYEDETDGHPEPAGGRVGSDG